MKEDLNIDSFFREGLSDIPVAPPDAVWEKIEAGLASSRKPFILPFYLKAAASVAIIAGITALTLFFIYRTDENSQTFSANNNTEDTRNKTENNTSKTPLSKVLSNSRSDLDKTDNEIAANSDAEIAESKIKSLYSDKQEELINTEVQKSLSEENNSDVAYNQSATLENDESITAESATYLENEKKDNSILSELNETSQTRTVEKPVEKILKNNELILQENLLALKEEEENKKKNNLLLTVGGQAGPQYTYRNVTDQSDYNNPEWDDFESGALAYAGGVNIALSPTKRLSVQSGFYYSKINNSKYEMLYTNSNTGNVANSDFPISYFHNRDNLTVQNSDAEDIPVAIDKMLVSNNTNTELNIDDYEYTRGDESTESFEFVEFPVIIKYKIVDRKMGVNLAGGVWTNILVGYQPADFQKEYLSEEYINKVNYSGSIGLGFDYPLADHLFFNLEPSFKYFFSSINKNPHTGVYPYTFSVMTGFSYSF